MLREVSLLLSLSDVRISCIHPPSLAHLCMPQTPALRVPSEKHIAGSSPWALQLPSIAQAKDSKHFKDKETGQDLEIVDRTPLLEWLANNYKKFGCNLDFITNR